MGALTLKEFPFEIRSWDVERFESFDPTDGFGLGTEICVSKGKVLVIEPDHITSIWLSDKSRQFFDGIVNNKGKENENTEKRGWVHHVLQSVTDVLYVFDHCSARLSQKNFFTIIFENLTIEALSILYLLAQKYSFVKLRRAENFNYSTIDTECDYQLNTTTTGPALNAVTLCMLVSANPRYEGYSLNLKLRQRFLKGNFKCFVLGSYVNLNFPALFIGSSMLTIKSIAEGNCLICRDLKKSTNTITVYNNELLKRKDGRYALEIIKNISSLNDLNKAWASVGMLNPSICDVGINTLYSFSPVTSDDYSNFSSLYFLNVTSNNLSNLKKITDLKLLNYTLVLSKEFSFKRFLLNQNSTSNNLGKINVYSEKLKDFHLPTSPFYGSNETYLNTEGLVKRVSKSVTYKRTKSSWRLIKQVLKSFNSHSFLLYNKNKRALSHNVNKSLQFKSYINFQFYAIKNITWLCFSLTLKNYPVIFYNKSLNFKPKVKKIHQTKVRQWLDDFYTGGSDSYSQESSKLVSCSTLVRSETTVFDN